MKKFASIFAMMLLAVTCVLAGCGYTYVGPGINDNVYGNGSYVVRKGDYVYYANGYLTADGSDNKTGNVDYAGLYRAKDNGGTLEDPKLIVSKIVGFENSGIFIYGDKLYFATPSTRTDSTGELRDDLITFYSAALDGSGLKDLYTTESFSSGKFGFTVVDGQASIIVFTGTDIIRIFENGKNEKLVEGATGFAMYSPENIYGNTFTPSAFESSIYYTKARTEEQLGEVGATGNVLYKTDLSSKTETLIYMETGVTLSLEYAAGGRIFYTRNERGTTDTRFYSSSGTERGNFKSEEISHSAGTGNLVTKNGENYGIVYTANSKLYFRDFSGSAASIVTLVNASATIKFTKGSYVYYTFENKLYRIDTASVERTPEELSTDSLTFKTDYADADDDYFYFTAQYAYSEEELENMTDEEKAAKDVNYYMYRVALKEIENKADGVEPKYEIMKTIKK